MLASIRGTDAYAYNHVLAKLENVLDILPIDKTSDFSKIIKTGEQRGLINNLDNGIHDRRHAILTFETIIENEDVFKRASEIEFEAVLETIDNIPNSVPDIKITIIENGVQKTLIGEVYAGLAGAKSNLASQSLTYFQEVNDIRNLRFFRRANLTNKTLAKQAVIDAWRNWENGKFLKNQKVKSLFEKFDDEVSKSNFDFEENTVESFLESTDEWFELIFNRKF